MSEPILEPELRERPPIEDDDTFRANLESLIEAGRRGMVVNLVVDLHAADIARLLPHLPFDEANTLFHWLPEEQAADVLTDLDDDYRAALLEEASAGRIQMLIDEMDVDDAADVLADLPEEIVQDVLPHLEDSEELEQLLRYDEETAGGLMNSEYVAARADQTVADATEEVRRLAEEVDPVYTVYVLDEHDRLVGRVSLKRLLLTRATVPMRDIMKTDMVTVLPDIDQEEVARIMERYDLVALPVVDADDRLLGRITIDDVVDVIREEAEEDIQRMSGIAKEEDLTDSVFSVSRGRLVWLYVGLFGAFMSALVIRQFEGVLETYVTLAMFIPVVMAMAGNAGIQSSAIAVQGLASGELWASDLGRQFLKELAVALINGLAVSVVFGVVLIVMQQIGWTVTEGEVVRMMGFEEAGRLALAVGLSLLTVIILAASIGALIPLALDRVDIDPAIATGPFITTTNDILGLIIYFAIASVLVLS